MIIDKILDRRDGKPYNPHEFYLDIMSYGTVFPDLAHPITEAMDEGTEGDVKEVLCDYIDANDYNPDIKNFINNENWI